MSLKGKIVKGFIVYWIYEFFRIRKKMTERDDKPEIKIPRS